MRTITTLGAIGFVLVAACGGDSDSSPPLSDTASQLIGPLGGTLEVTGGGKVEIPPGALSTRIEIKVTKLELNDVAPLPTNLEAAGKPYAFEPHGLNFAQPIKITLPFDGDAAEVRPVKLDDETDVSWQTVVGAEKTDDSKLEIGTISFSIYLAARPRRESGVVTLPDGATLPEDAGFNDGGNRDASMVTDAGHDATTGSDAGVDAAVAMDAATRDAAVAMDAAMDSAMTDAGVAMDAAIDATTVGMDASVMAFLSVAQEAYVKPSNTKPSLDFGASVAIDGDTMVIGAPTESSSATGVNGDETDATTFGSGAAYVFVRGGSGDWVQQAYLKASNTGGADAFGQSVAISGDTIVVGARQEGSSATGVNGNGANNSYNQSGAAYVFVRTDDPDAGMPVWTQQAYLKASNTNPSDWFGYSVAIDGDTVVVGAPRESSVATGVNGNEADNSASYAGAAYVFVRSAMDVWSQQAYLKANSSGAQDEFGGAVAISGDTIAVGAGNEDSFATGIDGQANNDVTADSGAVFVFVRGGITWAQQAYVKASNTGQYDRFGISVSLDGDTLAVGADGEASGVASSEADNSAQNAGATYVFTRSGTTWSQQAYLKASNLRLNDLFGRSVAVAGDHLIVGAYWEDGSGTGIDASPDTNLLQSGAAYLFRRSGGTWSQQHYVKASNTGASDFFGYAVAITNDTAVVGARQEASDAIGVGGDQANNNANYAGAVYVFQ